LKPEVAGDIVAATAVTEPVAGSDVSAGCWIWKWEKWKRNHDENPIGHLTLPSIPYIYWPIQILQYIRFKRHYNFVKIRGDLL
jgi:hypothetical protein